MAETRTVEQRTRIWRCTATTCGHVWTDRKQGRKPNVCPKCHKYLYIEEVEQQ